MTATPANINSSPSSKQRSGSQSAIIASAADPKSGGVPRGSAWPSERSSSRWDSGLLRDSLWTPSSVDSVYPVPIA